MQIDAINPNDAMLTQSAKQAHHGIHPHPPTTCACIATPNCSSELCVIQREVVEDYCAVYSFHLVPIAIADEATDCRANSS